MEDMIDDIRDKIKDTDKWLENARNSLDEIDSALDLAIMCLDDIRSGCSDNLEGIVIKTMDHVKKAKEIAEDL